MKKIIKTLLITCLSTIILCSTAFAAENGTVIANILNIRSGPSTSNSIVGKLYVGNTVSIIAKENNWYQIEYGNKKAYVSGDYVSINATSRSSFRTDDTTISNEVVSYAKNYIGVPYRYGGTTPLGFDCSGFTQYVMKNFNIFLPRSSGDQYSIGTRVSKSQLIAGDLVFFNSAGSNRINHVGMYVGDGKFIHAPIPGQSVKIDSLVSGYFNTYYYGATRVLK